MVNSCIRDPDSKKIRLSRKSSTVHGATGMWEASTRNFRRTANMKMTIEKWDDREAISRGSF